VRSVELVTRDQAMERFAETLGGASLLDGLEENPLPASLEITLLEESRSSQGIGVLEQALTGLPGIDELAHGREWIDGYARAAALVRLLALGLGSVLAFAALLIIANTIRLAIYAREDELEILSLVGASRLFLRVPFLLEGTLQGALGGSLAALLLYLAFSIFQPQIQSGLGFFLGNLEPRFFDASELTAIILGGAGLGMLGSAVALLSWRSAQSRL
jgi:cell division transport system permease protein